MKPPFRSRTLAVISFSLCDQAITAIGALLVTILLARSTTVAEFGVYSIVVAFWAVVNGVLTALFVDPMHLIAARMKGRAIGRYGGSVVLAVFIASSGAAVLLALGTALVVEPSLTRSIILAQCVAGPPFMAFVAARRLSYLDAIPIPATIAASVQFTLTFGLMVWLMRGDRLSAPAALHMQAIAFAASSVVLLALLRPGVPLGWVRWRALARRHWRFGSWLTWGSLANWVFYSFQIPMVGWIAGIDHAAILRAHLNLSAPMFQFFGALATPLTSAAARLQAAGRHAAMHQLLWWSALGFVSTSAVFAGALALFGDRIMELMYGAGPYTGHAAMVFLLALLIMVNAVRQSDVARLYAEGRSSDLFKATLAAAAAGPVLGIPLTYIAGMEGAIAALIGCYIILAAMVYRAVRRRAKPGPDPVR